MAIRNHIYKERPHIKWSGALLVFKIIDNGSWIFSEFFSWMPLHGLHGAQLWKRFSILIFFACISLQGYSNASFFRTKWPKFVSDCKSLNSIPYVSALKSWPTFFSVQSWKNKGLWLTFHCHCLDHFLERDESLLINILFDTWNNSCLFLLLVLCFRYVWYVYVSTINTKGGKMEFEQFFLFILTSESFEIRVQLVKMLH